VFGVQNLTCFLYGRRFKVITDYAALKWLLTVQNHQCARLTRWVLKFAEYDFQILHRPAKHTNAAVLALCVAAEMRIPITTNAAGADVKPQEEVSLSKQAIRQTQVKDEFCQQINQALCEGRYLLHFWDQDSVVYHRSPDTSGDRK
jgi:hypothetical protein